jgi:hypothetical protein
MITDNTCLLVFERLILISYPSGSVKMAKPQIKEAAFKSYTFTHADLRVFTETLRFDGGV